MFCKNCGHECMDNTSYCTQCGTALVETEISSTQHQKHKKASASKLLSALCYISIVINFISAVILLISNSIFFRSLPYIYTETYDYFGIQAVIKPTVILCGVILGLYAPICFTVALWRIKSLCDYNNLRFMKWYYIFSIALIPITMLVNNDYSTWIAIVVNILMILAFRGYKTTLICKVVICLHALSIPMTYGITTEMLLSLAISLPFLALLPIILIIHAKERAKLEENF